MNLYFDTSALIKLFHEEKGTVVVTDLIENKENKIYISELAKIEFYCALYRRLRNNEISKKDLEKAVNGFEIQIQDFNIDPLGHAVINEAEKLIKRFGCDYGLRTLDALQLATFYLISEEDWNFVTTDITLYKVVIATGLRAINPLNMERNSHDE
ncbi:type II toxin-antitoxin system VapC family toxin [candidate division KSB1 bacterium]|nr:type II toxin-antitoxin system VapC family toxin [candidate division KSB1 bacterium]MBL7093241.1 type II toxin-antitoxin system VapC family toxin [candidate division KSB1 bacterium]